MTKIVLSHEDYERVLREGLDLDAYLQGRFDEAASEVKYLNEEVDVIIPISIDGERLGEALAKSTLPVQWSEGSEIKKFHEDCHKAFMEAAYQATSVTCESDATRRRILHAQYTADRANDRLDELIKRISYKLPDGTSVMIGDALEFPENRVAKVIRFDEGTSLPIAINWLEDERTEWMTESEMMEAKKLPA